MTPKILYLDRDHQQIRNRLFGNYGFNIWKFLSPFNCARLRLNRINPKKYKHMSEQIAAIAITNTVHNASINKENEEKKSLNVVSRGKIWLHQSIQVYFFNIFYDFICPTHVLSPFSISILRRLRLSRSFYTFWNKIYGVLK